MSRKEGTGEHGLTMSDVTMSNLFQYLNAYLIYYIRGEVT